MNINKDFKPIQFQNLSFMKMKLFYFKIIMNRIFFKSLRQLYKDDGKLTCYKFLRSQTVF